MGKTESFIKTERDTIGKVFVDINYAIDNISPFLSEQDLKKRKYIIKIPVLKKYMELLDAAERESAHKSGFLNLFNDDKYINLLMDYKRSNDDTVNQLQKCSKCSCLNCIAPCKFDSCLGCREGSHIAQCDHKKINVTFHHQFTIELTNNRIESNESYLVLATLQDVEKDQRYIITQGVLNKNDKYILYYTPGIVEDTFGEISDEQEFDFVLSIFQGTSE
jgi:hypothetical protein